MDRFYDELDMRLKTRPLLEAENHDCNLAARKILLIAHVLVGRQQDLEACVLGHSQEVAVLQRVPVLLRGRSPLQRRGRPYITQE